MKPFGQPRSVCKSNTECRFLESWDEMAKWPWKSMSMIPIFNTCTSQQNLNVHIWCKFVDSSSNPLQLSYCTDKPNFLEFWVKMAKMTLKVKVNGSHCISHDTCLMQICRFQPKSVTELWRRLAKFLIKVKMAKMTLKVKYNDPYLWY